MPNIRLVMVAIPIALEDFSICDISGPLNTNLQTFVSIKKFLKNRLINQKKFRFILTVS